MPQSAYGGYYLKEVLFSLAEGYFLGGQLGINAPLLSCKTHVVVITPLGICLCGIEQFLCIAGEHLEERSETHLTFEEVVKLAPVRLLAIKSEGILALVLKSGVITPELPVTALNSTTLLFLAMTHADFEAMVDTG